MEEEDFTKLPIVERCVHKSWKARLSGYEAVANLFRHVDDEKSAEWNKYVGLVKKFVVDSNAPAQEKGLEAVLAFVENCASAGKTVYDVMVGLVNKCISASKARTKELAAEIAFMYIEIEKQEIVLDELLKGTESKNPKISAASINLVTQALKIFGSKVVDAKKILKRLTKLLEDRDNTVRAEAKLLCIEMYQWLGPSIQPYLSNLKQVQVAEMDAEFQKVNGVCREPTRLLRSQQLKTERPKQDFKVETQCSEVEDVDPYDSFPATDILNQLPDDLYAQLESKKWSERKDALEMLNKILASAPKIVDADYGELIKALKKIIAKDSNVVVVGFAINCVSSLANGLKKNFQQYAGVMMQALLEKFKERKQNVVLALREAVDAVFPSTNLESLLEDIVSSLESKNPSVKSETASFLARCFSKVKPAVLNKKLMKALMAPLLKCLYDQDPSVRDNAALAIGTAMKYAGERAVKPFFVDLDNQKMAKINDCNGKAELSVKPKKAVTQSDSSPQKSSGTALNQNKTKEHKPSKLQNNKKAVKATTPSKNGVGDEEMIKNISAHVINGLSSSDDKERLKAYNELYSAVKKLKCYQDIRIPNVMIHTGNGTLEASSPVIQIKLKILKHIASRMTFSQDSVKEILSDIVPAFVKPDCAELVGETLCTLTKNTSLRFVMHSLFDDKIIQGMSEVWIEIFNWLSTSVLKNCQLENLNFMIECGIQAFEHNSPDVKNAGLALIGAAQIVLNHSINSSTQTECFKSTSIASKSSKFQDVSDRVDIGSSFTQQLISELGDKDWKIRAEAVSKTQSIINSAKNITTNLGGAAPAIAARIIDSNSKIAVAAIMLVESLAPAMGPSCKQHLPIFLPVLIKSFADPNDCIKTAVVSCLNKWLEIGGYHEFFDCEILEKGLKMGSPSLRCELWSWMADTLGNIAQDLIPKNELSACLPLLYANLEDRNAYVRKCSQAAVLGFMMHLGFNKMSTAFESMSSNDGSKVASILERTRDNLQDSRRYTSRANEESGKRSESSKVTESYFKPATHFGGTTKSEENGDVFFLQSQRLRDEQKIQTLKRDCDKICSGFVDQQLESSTYEDSLEEAEDSLEEELGQNHERFCPIPKPSAELVEELVNSKPHICDQRINIDTRGLVDPSKVLSSFDDDSQIINDETKKTSSNERAPSPMTIETQEKNLSSVMWELKHIENRLDIDSILPIILRLNIVIDSGNAIILSGRVDQIVEEIIEQLGALGTASHPERHFCYRACFAVLDKLTKAPELWKEVSEATLFHLLRQLIDLLTYLSSEPLDENDTLNRGVNFIVTKILQKTNKTALVRTLISMIPGSTCVPELSEKSQFQRFAAKVLWKLVRNRTEWDAELDYAIILKSVHDFLEGHPDSREMAQEDRDGVNTLKTFLRTMIKIRGTEVEDTIKSMIDVSPQSQLSIYVKNLSEKLKSQEVDGNNIPQRSLEDDLQEIVQAISESEEISLVAKKIQKFRKSYPDVNLKQLLSKASPEIQQHIAKLSAASEYNEQLEANGRKGEGKASHENSSSSKTQLSKDGERWKQRLHQLQAKAGIYIKNECEKINKPLEKLETPKKIVNGFDENLQNIKERFELIKSNLS